MSVPQNKMAESLVYQAAFRQFDQVLTLDIETSTYVLYEVANNQIAGTKYGNYDELLIRFAGLIPKMERPQFLSNLDLSMVEETLKSASDYIVSFRTLEEFYYKLTFSYLDETKNTILITRQNETTYAKELRLIKESFRWDRERLYFLLEHVCEDFIEINPQTGSCCILSLKRKTNSKGTIREQIEWLADHLIVESQREAFLQDFALEQLVASLRHNNGLYQVQYDVTYSDGRHTLRISSVLLPKSNSYNEERIYTYTQDFTDLRQQEEKNKRLVDISKQLLNLSQTEPLTGLYNRTACEKIIAEHLGMTVSGCYGTMLLLDIDYFKTCNDVHGHQTGDHVLCYLAKAMREVFRSDDILSRWGGDEFLVFMRNIGNIKSIEGRLARLRDKMRECKKKDGDPLPITLSIGGVIAIASTTVTELFMEADNRLYDVKKRGRDGAIISKQTVK